MRGQKGWVGRGPRDQLWPLGNMGTEPVGAAEGLGQGPHLLGRADTIALREGTAGARAAARASKGPRGCQLPGAGNPSCGQNPKGLKAAQA